MQSIFLVVVLFFSGAELYYAFRGGEIEKWYEPARYLAIPSVVLSVWAMTYSRWRKESKK